MENTEKDQIGTQEPTVNNKNNIEPTEKTLESTNQSNINQHSKSTFEDMIIQGLKYGGIHLTGNKGSGKTRLLWAIAENLMQNQNIRMIAFDGSESWIYGFSQIPTFNICEHDIISSNLRSTEEMESYSFENWNLVKLALEKHKDILFRLKTTKPSKRGYAIRKIICHLDDQQRAEKARTATHENSKAIAYVLDEIQDAFTNRNTARLDMESFLCIYAEMRNSRESLFSSSQRLTDVSKAVRAKALYCLGKLNPEDLSPFLRRTERIHKIDFANMPQRTWFYEGSTFTSPEWKQQGKPYKINAEIIQEWLNSLPKQKTVSLKEKIAKWFNFSVPLIAKPIRTQNSFFESRKINLEENEDSENSELEENLTEEERDLREIEEELI